MQLTKKIYQRFNTPETLVVLSSFPLQHEEIAKRNAVSRYTFLLLKHLAKSQLVVVVCERVAGQDNRPYLLKSNVLVLPTFEVNSWLMFGQIIQVLNRFSEIKKVLVQFEFSLFGKEIIAFCLSIFLGFLRLQGKQVYTMLHQVVTDLGTLSKQVNITRGSVKAKLINLAMRSFYVMLGLGNQKILVHDNFLAEKLHNLVPQAKIKVIPHGIASYKSYSTSQKAKFKQELGIQPQQKVLLVYGYHSWYKGTDFILKAFENFSARYPGKYKLVLAGDTAPTQLHLPHLKKYQLDLAQDLKLASKAVIHTGFVPETQVGKIFAVSDLVIFPYRSRMSSSGALSVALQYHKPFICSPSFSENLTTPGVLKALSGLKLTQANFTFDLNQSSFNKTVSGFFRTKTTVDKMVKLAKQLAQARSWSKMATEYQAQLKAGQPAKDLGLLPVDLALDYETS